MSEMVPNNQKSFVMSEIVSRIRTIEKNEPKHILTISSTQGWVDQRERWSREMAGESLRKYTKLKNGDFSYNKGNSKTFPYGCIFRLDKWEEAVVPNVYHSFAISHDQVNSDYLQQYFWSGGLDKQLRKVLTSSVRDNGLLNITADTFFSLKVSLPPLPEQKKIASILTSVDEVIETTQKQIDKLQDLKKATMNELLTKGIGHTEFKDSELGRIPKSWRINSIAECCEILDSQRIPLNSEERSKRLGEYPYYGANGIQGYIDDFIFDGDAILVAEDGGNFDQYAERPIAQWVTGKYWVNNHAHILRAKENDLDKWIFYSLVHKNILKFINGGTRAKLNQSDLREIQIYIPPLPEQKKIASILTSVDEVIETTQKQIDKLQDLKKSLMQDLLTGKVRVQVN